MWAVATFVLKHKIKRTKRYPLVLQLEPLFRCNLSCAGCGKIQYPPHILKRQLTPEQCWAAAEECGTPVVAIPGGEPMLHPQIKEIVEGLIARKKYVYVCTNALLLKQRLEEGVFKPNKRLTFSVHMDGQEEHHDFAVCREGTYKTAVEAIRYAVSKGFRVTTNTTLFQGADPNSVRAFMDEMMALGVEGCMLSPGYAYPKAPDQKSFMTERSNTIEFFKMVLSNRKKSWKFNASPLFLEYLMGKRDFECTPWGLPTYCIFGWQKPCYLLQDGYVDTFKELIEETEWERYGRASGNRACQQCMVHCGYEPTAVDHTFSGVGGLLATIKAMAFPLYKDDEAAARLAEEAKKPHGPMVQLGITVSAPKRESEPVGAA
jgi:hopanoid biosynthesis associated radical SAM protein HpnH